MSAIETEVAEGLNILVKKLREWADWGELDQISGSLRTEDGSYLTITVDADRKATAKLGNEEWDLGSRSKPFGEME